MIDATRVEDKIEQLRDSELTAFTDALLAGREELSAGGIPLAETVRILARTISPQSPPEQLRRKVRQQIAVEWERQFGRPALLRELSLNLRQQLAGLFKPPVRRWAWATAGVLIVTVLVTALLVPGSAGKLTGTAAGGAETIMVAVLLMLVGILAAGWWVFRKK